MSKYDFLPLKGLKDTSMMSKENSCITVQSVSLFSELQLTWNPGSSDCCCLLGFIPFLFPWRPFDLHVVFHSGVQTQKDKNV